MLYDEPPRDFSPICEVAACYVQCDDHILFLWRQDHKPEGNTYCIPGGKLDALDGALETPLDAVIRETFQETGIVLAADHVRFYNTFYVQYPEYAFVYHLFSSKLGQKPQIRIKPDEHKAYAWKAPAEALNLPLARDEDECLRRFFRL